MTFEKARTTFSRNLPVKVDATPRNGVDSLIGMRENTSLLRLSQGKSPDKVQPKNDLTL
jgi:hypothetical protein